MKSQPCFTHYDMFFLKSHRLQCQRTWFADHWGLRMNIAIATRANHAQLVELDHHVTPTIIARKIEQREIIRIEEDDNRDRLAALQLFLGYDPVYEYAERAGALSRARHWNAAGGVLGADLTRPGL